MKSLKMLVARKAYVFAKKSGYCAQEWHQTIKIRQSKRQIKKIVKIQRTPFNSDFILVRSLSQNCAIWFYRLFLSCGRVSEIITGLGDFLEGANNFLTGDCSFNRFCEVEHSRLLQKILSLMTLQSNES